MLLKMTVKEPKDFILENYFRRIRFTKGCSCYLMKHKNTKKFLLLATKVTKKYLMLVMLNNNF